MLKFDSNEDAIFMGLEAEGPMKGTPTLFIVGEPCSENVADVLPKFVCFAEHFKSPPAIYFGAGGSCTLPDGLIFQGILNVLNAYANFDKLTICIETSPVPFSLARDVHTVVRRNLSATTEVRWIFPVLWESTIPERTDFATLTDVKRIDNLLALCDATHSIWGKVYSQDKVLVVAEWKDLHFADYDNNIGEFQTDKLLWSSKQKGI